MDAEGFIPISLIASFYRVQALSQDQDLILKVCIHEITCTFFHRKTLQFQVCNNWQNSEDMNSEIKQ